MYSFRLRFFLTGGARINLDTPSVDLSSPPASLGHVRLMAYGLAPPLIAATSHLVVEGDAYPSSADALAAGKRWRGILELAFAASNLGADFGDGKPAGGLTDMGAQILSAQAGTSVVRDAHGLATFATQPRPKFLTSSATATVGRSGERVLRALALAEANGSQFDDRQRVAYDLFSASMGLEMVEARFVMLMMAVETLIEPAPRPEVSRAHVAHLIRMTNSAELDSSERASIVGALEWLSDESISQAGRRLAATLGDRTYAGRAPKRFFTDCYAIRSRLVHGLMPRPSWQEITVMVGDLESFTRDLLVIDLSAALAESVQQD